MLDYIRLNRSRAVIYADRLILYKSINWYNAIWRVNRSVYVYMYICIYLKYKNKRDTCNK